MAKAKIPNSIMDDIPRGLPDKYLRDQSIPQARWQSEEMIKSSTALEYDPKNPDGKILIGAIGDKLIGLKDNRHMLTCAPSRSGKSVTVMGNVILCDGSIFINDPKAEIANKTASHRAKMGDVEILDPFNRTRGKARQYVGTYNPLSPLDLESDSLIEQVMQIIDGIVMQTGEEKDPHWNEAAGDFIKGLLLYIKCGEGLGDEERNLITLRKLVGQALKATSDADGNKIYVLPMRIMQAIQHLRTDENEDIAEVIAASIKGFYEKPSKEMASVLSMVRRQTAFLDFRGMKRTLVGGTLDLRDLKRSKRPLTVYICLPATRMAMCKRWLRVIINQLVDAMEFEETVPRVPVLAILDEFAVLGHMAQLEEAIGQVASFHLRLWIIIQDWGQGKALYKDRWESFAANAGVCQFFANTDLTTTEYISKRLGKTIVQSTRRSDAGHDEIERGRAGHSQSRDLYDLMAADEVARFFGRADPHKRQIIMMAGLHPMIVPRVEYWNKDAPYHHIFKGKYENLD